MDDLDKQLLDAIQKDFPLDERPYRLLADRLGSSEDEVLDRLRQLQDAGIIRQISAIFDSARIGYKSVLLAFRVPPGRMEEAAQVLSRHPGISHNYQRDHAFNIWSALTVHSEGNLGAHAEALSRQAEADAFLFLPAKKVFKIGVFFQNG